MEHDGHTAATLYGAEVTPRNTVLDGAVASTSDVRVAVLYEYSVVAEVAYNINTHASARPAREMMTAPDCSSVLAGTVRVHTVVYVYNARLLMVVVAVSVAQIVVALENTNPYGNEVVLTSRVPTGLAAVGRPVKAMMPVPTPPALEPSVQYRVEGVATRVPFQSYSESPRQPEEGGE